MMSRKIFGIPLPYILGALLVGLIVTVVLILTVGVGLYNMLADGSYNTPIACEQSEGCRVLQPILFTALFLFIVVTGFATRHCSNANSSRGSSSVSGRTALGRPACFNPPQMA